MINKFHSFIEPYMPLLGNTKGIDNNDIFSIEKQFEIELPLVYKEFLLMFGKNTGNLLESYYMNFPALLDNKEDANSALNFDDRKSEQEKPTLLNSYFFFGQWQGYIFYFFDCSDKSDDPPVYILTDNPEIKKYKNSFTEFIYDEGIKPLLDLQRPDHTDLQFAR